MEKLDTRGLTFTTRSDSEMVVEGDPARLGALAKQLADMQAPVSIIRSHVNNSKMILVPLFGNKFAPPPREAAPNNSAPSNSTGDAAQAAETPATQVTTMNGVDAKPSISSTPSR